MRPRRPRPSPASFLEDRARTASAVLSLVRSDRGFPRGRAMAISDGCRVRFRTQPQRATGTLRSVRLDTHLDRDQQLSDAASRSVADEVAPAATALWGCDRVRPAGRAVGRDRRAAGRRGRQRKTGRLEGFGRSPIGRGDLGGCHVLTAGPPCDEPSVACRGRDMLSIAQNQGDGADRRLKATLDERVRTVSGLCEMTDQELLDVTA